MSLFPRVTEGVSPPRLCRISGGRFSCQLPGEAYPIDDAVPARQSKPAECTTLGGIVLHVQIKPRK